VAEAVEIAATPAEIFAVLEDIDRLGRFLPESVFRRVEPAGGQRKGPGASMWATTMTGRRSFRVRLVLTEIQRPRRLVLAAVEGPIVYRLEYDLAEAGPGAAHVTLATVYPAPRTALSRWFDRTFLQHTIRAQHRVTLDALDRAVVPEGSGRDRGCP
jgi:carbon monoxide dehydrogenase subunit G